MMVVTAQVTDTPAHLKQIGQIGILNQGEINDTDVCQYVVFLDGEQVGEVTHKRSEGWLRLLKKVTVMMDNVESLDGS